MDKKSDNCVSHNDNDTVSVPQLQGPEKDSEVHIIEPGVPVETPVISLNEPVIPLIVSVVPFNNPLVAQEDNASVVQMEEKEKEVLPIENVDDFEEDEEPFDGTLHSSIERNLHLRNSGFFGAASHRFNYHLKKRPTEMQLLEAVANRIQRFMIQEEDRMKKEKGASTSSAQEVEPSSDTESTDSTIQLEEGEKVEEIEEEGVEEVPKEEEAEAPKIDDENNQTDDGEKQIEELPRGNTM